MPDQLLDRIAADAPDGGPNYADRMLNAARRDRRRRWTVAASTAAVVLAITVPLGVGATVRGHHSTDAGPTTAARPTARPDISDEAQIDAAAIRYVARAALPSVGLVYVVDKTCDLRLEVAARCEPRPIPTDLQRQISEVPGPFPIRWVSRDHPSSVPSLPVPGERVLVSLGNVSVSADEKQAQMQVGSSCGPLCGTGGLLLLENTGSGWTVTKFTATWIN